MPTPTIAEIEAKFGEPASSWHGRCAELAECVRKMIPGSRRARGMYIGPITGAYWKGREFTQHEWVILKDDETVVDPTRWSFEGKDPYVFVGQDEDDGINVCLCGHLSDEHSNGFFQSCGACECPDLELEKKEVWPYDEGGNAVRDAFFRKPCPPFETGPGGATLRGLHPDAFERLKALGLRPSGGLVSQGQLFWIANENPSRLEPYTRDIYCWLSLSGAKPLIPMDNRKKYFPGEDSWPDSTMPPAPPATRSSGGTEKLKTGPHASAAATSRDPLRSLSSPRRERREAVAGLRTARRGRGSRRTFPTSG